MAVIPQLSRSGYRLVQEICGVGTGSFKNRRRLSQPMDVCLDAFECPTASVFMLRVSVGMLA